MSKTSTYSRVYTKIDTQKICSVKTETVYIEIEQSSTMWAKQTEAGENSKILVQQQTVTHSSYIIYIIFVYSE